MARHGKKYLEAAKLVDRERVYSPAEAAQLAKDTTFVGFDATVEAHLRLGVIRPLSSGAHDASVIHPRKRFYAGGSQSVRWFVENMLGPRVLTVDPILLDSLVGGVRRRPGAHGHLTRS